MFDDLAVAHPQDRGAVDRHRFAGRLDLVARTSVPTTAGFTRRVT
jgi:hypothetical protein